jgi:hypothetical protein
MMPVPLNPSRYIAAHSAETDDTELHDLLL